LWRTKEESVAPEEDFAHLLVVIAIAVHLSNYFVFFGKDLDAGPNLGVVDGE